MQPGWEDRAGQVGPGLTILARVAEVLSKVTAEHPLPQDAPLPQPLPGRAGVHEGAEEAGQLPTWPGHSCGRKGGSHRVSAAPGLVGWGAGASPLVCIT